MEARREGLLVLDDLRGDDFARPTPGGEAVEDDEALLLHGRVKVGFGLEIVDSLFGHGDREETYGGDGEG